MSLTSYDDLLVRMENLEQQVNHQSAQMVNVPAYSTCEPCACDDGCGRYYAGYEAVFVTPYQSNNTGIIALNDPVIEHLGFDWDMKHSNRIELGYLGAKGAMGWRARYWQFDQSTSFEVDSDVGLVQDEGAIIWSSTNGGSSIIGLVDVDTAVMTHSIDLNVLDLEMQTQATKNFLLSGGFRYAEIDQSYLAVTDSGIAMGDIKFRGYGPTMAGEYSRPLFCGWDMFANGRGSMLFGQQQFLATDDNDDLFMDIENTGTLAGSMEMQLGLKWTSRNERFFFKSALEAQYWANVGSPNPAATYTDDSDEASVDDVLNENLGFIGFTIGGGIQY
ncbi:Lpg1974 family pore-forming outer membrane protein [Bremerella sp. JC770]|uniref:Lpg1974 family pore-forming outer membrane protein n=1 Tax=Bremerella sp. JC770 TaxID=3232137 RepID=UPI003458AE22